MATNRPRQVQSSPSVFPPADQGFVHWNRIISGARRDVDGEPHTELYTTTGTYAPDAPSQELEHLHRAGALIGDADLVDWFVGKKLPAEKHAALTLSATGKVYDGAGKLRQKVTAEQSAKWMLHMMSAEKLAKLKEQHRTYLLSVVEPIVGRPTVIVDSGYGWHLHWWLLDGQGYREGAGNIETLRGLNAAFVAHVNTIAGFDLLDRNCKDPGTRILRELGETNNKAPTAISVTEIERDEARRFDASATWPWAGTEMPEPTATKATTESKAAKESKTSATKESSEDEGEATKKVGWFGLELTLHDCGKPGNESMTVADWYQRGSKHDEPVKIEPGSRKMTCRCPFYVGSVSDSAWIWKHTDGRCQILCRQKTHSHSAQGLNKWNFRAFDRASHTELARHIVVKLKKTGDVVYDRGELRQCRDGAWHGISDDDVTRTIQDLDGLPTGKGSGKNTIQLKVNDGTVSGTIRQIRAQVSRPGFFDHATCGCAFQNGFVTQTGDLEPITPEHRIIAEHVLPWSYNPTEKAPRWLQFLDEVMAGQPEAKELQDVLQEHAGGALLGISTRYHKALFLYGARACNGKSTYIETIAKLFPNATSNLSPQAMGRQFGAHVLAKSRLNYVSDLPVSQIEESSVFLSIMSEDTIEADRKNRDSIRFITHAAEMFGGNKLQRADNLTEGFFRRWLVVPFLVSFLGREDHTLKHVLESELPGISVWAIEGAIRLLRQDHYTPTKAYASIMKEWKEEVDSVRGFRDTLDLEVDPKTTRVRTDIMYAAYASYCRENGHQPLAKKRFSRELREKCDVPKGDDEHGMYWVAHTRRAQDPNVIDVLATPSPSPIESAYPAEPVTAPETLIPQRRAAVEAPALAWETITPEDLSWLRRPTPLELWRLLHVGNAEPGPEWLQYAETEIFRAWPETI